MITGSFGFIDAHQAGCLISGHATQKLCLNSSVNGIMVGFIPDHDIIACNYRIPLTDLVHITMIAASSRFATQQKCLSECKDASFDNFYPIVFHTLSKMSF